MAAIAGRCHVAEKPNGASIQGQHATEQVAPVLLP